MTTDMSSLYRAHCKPKLADFMRVLKVDRAFVRAQGNYLYDEDGVAYLDLVGGFGAALLGHNHPELVRALTDALGENVPVHAQGSPRAEAARLAEQLNKLLPGGAGYYVNFANSGTESVEAAVKHAYKAHLDRLQRECERVTRACNDLCARVAEENLEVALPGDAGNLDALRKTVDARNRAEIEAFRTRPVIVALKGAFHGKTATSLKVTFNESFRRPFEGLSALHPVFIDMKNPERLAKAVEHHNARFRYPVLDHGRVVLRSLRVTRVMAFIMEPILGEGGIQVVPDETLKALAALHARLRVPFIVDEIQTGCGRTGSFYYYTQTPLRDIEPEYIVLSKALGGGLVKIGATLIKKSIYDEDFGILHTSTFGEDELSCRVALKFLELLTGDGGKLLGRVKNRGRYLRARLERLRTRHPNIVAEVRGRGLMLGLELQAPPKSSPFLLAAAEQGLLSLLIASYLQEHHRIRLLAPLASIVKDSANRHRPSIIRIQPPVTLTKAEIDRLINALDEVFTVIAANNEYCLLGHLSGHRVTRAQQQGPRRFTARPVDADAGERIDARVGFVVHPTQVEHVVSYYFPSFEHYGWDREAFARWWNGLARFLDPVRVFRGQVRSRGRVLETDLILVPYLPEYLAGALSADARREVQDKVRDAVTLAKQLGDEKVPTAMVGLGGYTSIVTDNGQTIDDSEVPVTTGNAYTAALVLDGIERAAARRGLDMGRAEAAVVGATGNIGLVLAQALAGKVGRLRLVGRPGETGLFRLRHVRQECLREILRLVHRRRRAERGTAESRLGGLGQALLAALLDTRDGGPGGLEARTILSALEADTLPSGLGKLVDAVLGDRLGESKPLPISLHNGLAAIAESDIVAVATSSPDRRLIRPDHVKPGAIVCCASMPSNLGPEFATRGDDFFAFDGGLARLPDDSRIDFIGMPGDGLAYGCLAETLMLGFEGRDRSFCKGRLTTAQLDRAVSMAERHGFEPAEIRPIGATLDRNAGHGTAAREAAPGAVSRVTLAGAGS